MENKRMMEKAELFKVLEKEFEATFINELIPGILHNFANPLNGIMGRSRLLQRRLEENVRKIRADHPDIAGRFSEDFQKILKDIELISHESDRLFDMFRNVAGKFYALGDDNDQSINLSELIENEIKFCDFYLDFKHQVKKMIHLNKEIPDVTGSPAEYSIAISTIIRHAMQAMAESEVKEFSVTASEIGHSVSLNFRDSGVPFPSHIRNMILKNEPIPSQRGEGGYRHLQIAFCILKNYGASIKLGHEGGTNICSIEIPCRDGHQE
jgi:signal transduction histidine kinase